MVVGAVKGSELTKEHNGRLLAITSKTHRLDVSGTYAHHETWNGRSVGSVVDRTKVTRLVYGNDDVTFLD